MLLITLILLGCTPSLALNRRFFKNAAPPSQDRSALNNQHQQKQILLPDPFAPIIDTSAIAAEEMSQRQQQTVRQEQIQPTQQTLQTQSEQNKQPQQLNAQESADEQKSAFDEQGQSVAGTGKCSSDDQNKIQQGKSTIQSEALASLIWSRLLMRNIVRILCVDLSIVTCRIH